MQISNAELRGRLMVLELLLPIVLTRAAEISGDPSAFISGVMANTQAMLDRAAAAAAPDEAEVAQYALGAFDELSDAMAQHLAQRSHPAGRG